MFFIFGWGHQTRKSFGLIKNEPCATCYQDNEVELIKVTTWITLFFIPVIPTKIKYVLFCHDCGRFRLITKEEFKNIVEGKDKATFTVNMPHHQEGYQQEEQKASRPMTEVQKNYWEELRQLEAEKGQLEN